MTDVARNETVRLEDDPQSEVFQNHCAFARISFDWIDDELPLDHSPSHDETVKTMPVPFDRSNRDDVDRTQEDLMIQLAGNVDERCLDILLASPSIDVADIELAEVDDWIRRSILDVRLSTRSGCGIDALFDNELSPLITTHSADGGPRYIEAGWRRTNTYPMNRHRPIEQGLYIVINQQHIIGLSTRASLFYSSHSLDEGTEYLSARCDLAYSPRLDFHPGAVRIARVTFADEDTWRTAARAAALP